MKLFEFKDFDNDSNMCSVKGVFSLALLYYYYIDAIIHLEIGIKM
jgi:hypothetical protein